MHIKIFDKTMFYSKTLFTFIPPIPLPPLFINNIWLDDILWDDNCIWSE